MIKIETTLYKYGSKNDTIVLTFDDEAEVLDYIRTAHNYTEDVMQDEEKYGESICKWTEKFTYKGVDYSFYADL